MLAGEWPLPSLRYVFISRFNKSCSGGRSVIGISTSPILEHLARGQRSPSTWEAPASLYATQRRLPLERLDYACRLLNNFYPQSCRRAWIAANSDHLVANSRHAEELIEFELT